MLWEDPRESIRGRPPPSRLLTPGVSGSQEGSTGTSPTPVQEPGRAGDMAEPFHLTEPCTFHHELGETLFLP